jgi:ABC-type branched-subunit amino acid transport system permease subunit
VQAVAETVQRQGRRLLIDAMSAFGAIALDAKSVPFDAVVASSNKCLEGVPGIGWLAAVLTPDRWLLWLGLLFVLSVYHFPTGIVGRLRAMTLARRIDR